MKLKDMIRTMKFKDIKKGNNQLYTTWGEQLDKDHVLEEYPRPQLRRNNYQILNGYWNYCITNESAMPERYDGEILVPFSPESILSGVNKQLLPGEFLWYKRCLHFIDITERRKENKRCILHFGAVDQYCEVYLNNYKVTNHIGGYLPFSVDITNVLIEGENTLVVKVTDDSDSSYHSRGKQKLDRGGLFYTAQSGIWQTVWIEWVPNIYITSVKITPLVKQRAVEVNINLNTIINRNFKISKNVFQIDIYNRDTLIQTVNSHQNNIIISMKDFDYWSPEHPFLYDVVITAFDDKVTSYFAMRLYEVKKDQKGIPRLYLNHKPYFQNGILDQGYWPDGLYTAPSDEALIFDIQKAKELGFNMMRKHIKIEPLRWYYHCDRLGMIVWQDMVNGGGKNNMFLVGYLPTFFPFFAKMIKDKHYGLLGRENEAGREEWLKECIETVEHLYNCPSIAVWVPFNEAWGQFDAKKVYGIIRHADNTRLIDHASGWFDQKCGDFKSIHNYFHSLKVKREKRPVVFSEFGGYACYIKDHSYSWQIFGYRIYINEEALNEAFQKLYQDEITKLKKKGLAAVVYTQISDVEDEVNGLFTYDRKVCKVKALK